MVGGLTPSLRFVAAAVAAWATAASIGASPAHAAGGGAGAGSWSAVHLPGAAPAASLTSLPRSVRPVSAVDSVGLEVELQQTRAQLQIESELLDAAAPVR